MKKNLLIFLFIFCFSHIIKSQLVTIIDAENNQPLELVTLNSKKPVASAISNSMGQTDISSFKDAEIIEIRLLGYSTLKKSYTEIEKDNFIISISPGGISLDEVVISATRWNQSIDEVPNKITRITPAQVMFRNPQTAADLLSGSSEIFIQKSQLGGGSPMIRGFATNRVLIAVDGIRMNTAIFRSGNLQNVISLDPLSIEMTEVLFGPGSVMYGSDAIGGVMSFQTLTPQFSYTDKAIVSGKGLIRGCTANDENTGHMDINIGWKKWSLISAFSISDFGDLKMGSIGPDEYLKPFYVKRIDSTDIMMTNSDQEVQVPSGYRQINTMQKVHFRPNDKFDFSYGFHYSATSDYSRYDRLIRTKNGLPRSAEWYYGPQIWMMNNITLIHSLNNRAYDQMAVRAAWQFFEESRIDRDFNDTERRHRIERVNAWSVNLDLNKSISDKNKILYGLEAIYNDIISTGLDENIITGEKIKGPSRYPKSEWESYAAYLTLEHQINEKLILQAGIRYNQFLIDAVFDTTFYPFPFTTAEVNKGAITGSLGIVYAANDRFTISLNLSTGFRSPNIDDLGKVFDSEPGSVVVPNPDLDAEYAYNGEFGIARIFGDMLKIDFTGYYTILNNAMVRRDFLLNGKDSIIYNGEMSRVQAIQNAAKAYVYGIQTGIEMKLPQGFGFNSRFNYQKGEEELDDGTTSPLRHAAPLFGSAHLLYQHKKIKLDWNIVYNDKVSYENLAQEEQGKSYMYAIDQNGNPYSPSWYTLNFIAQYKFRKEIICNGEIENITNQRYRPYSSGITAPGRNFILSLQVKF